MRALKKTRYESSPAAANAEILKGILKHIEIQRLKKCTLGGRVSSG
jgi:hypothetical protein